MRNTPICERQYASTAMLSPIDPGQFISGMAASANGASAIHTRFLSDTAPCSTRITTGIRATALMCGPSP